MSRWLQILGSKNLRAIPTTALGLGAFALDGVRRLGGALAGNRRIQRKGYVSAFSAAGSDFEGISYFQYLLRNTLSFCEAKSIEKTARILDGVSEEIDVTPLDRFLNMTASSKTYRTRYQQPDCSQSEVGSAQFTLDFLPSFNWQNLG